MGKQSYILFFLWKMLLTTLQPLSPDPHCSQWKLPDFHLQSPEGQKDPDKELNTFAKVLERRVSFLLCLCDLIQKN